MKAAIPSVILLLIVAGGCSNGDHRSLGVSTSIGDVAGSPAAPTGSALTVEPAPAPAQSSSDWQAASSTTPTGGFAPAGSASSATPAAGATYTIKPGDTLWRIAKSTYGDGHQSRKILDANPGLDPTKLRVGQTIILPS